MNTLNSVSVEECCYVYKIELSFIQSLDSHGLIQIEQSEGKDYIPHEQLGGLEKYMRLFYELQINMEGLEAISHLLNRVQLLQEEIKRLQNNQDISSY